jgi:RNA polymerase-binding transcription factor DksA
MSTDTSTPTTAAVVASVDFDADWLAAQREALHAERRSLTGQATRLEEEANSLLDDELGDDRFDDEGGEGDGMAVERDRDLMLSAQARETVAEIDDALARIAAGTYGYSTASGRPIPHERLEAIPWATLLVEETRGGPGSWSRRPAVARHRAGRVRTPVVRGTGQTSADRAYLRGRGWVS